VTVGEALGLLTVTEDAALRAGSAFALGVGGAELNVAIGVSRLDGRAAWLGRVGDDGIGALVTATLRGEGVDVAGVTVEAGRPTSLLVRGSAVDGVRRPSYYRVDGPGARMQPPDVPDPVIASASVLHVTGITPALSASARDTIRAAMLRAGTAGVVVSFDVNYRPALWSSGEARPVVEELIGLANHVFVGQDEAEALGWGHGVERLGARLSALGADVVIVKQAEAGATAIAAGRAVHVAAAPTHPVEMHGAGDAFAAGYIAELMRGEPLAARLATAAACAGCVIAKAGDWEGLPTRSEIGGPGTRTVAR
jgi:2-dehydro-3-deoxygluconokinase